jgi:hypothetical protein
MNDQEYLQFLRDKNDPNAPGLCAGVGSDGQPLKPLTPRPVLGKKALGVVVSRRGAILWR